MKAGLTISAAGHLALIAWGLVSFSPKPFAATDSVPVDVISYSEFSQIMAGSKAAPPTDKPKPVVDKVAEPNTVTDPTPKVADKPEIVPTAASAESKPEPKPAEPKPAEAKPKEKAPEPDPIAEALKKEAAKKKAEAKKLADAKKREEAKKKREEQKFNADKIAALLDKRAPQRQAATGTTVNQTASLGAPNGRHQTLSANEIDALRAKIQACWNPPAGVADAKELIVTVRIMLKQDGSLAAEPAILNRSSNPLFQIAAESALRAIRRCAPYDKLPIAKYDVWKDVEVNFDPRDMFRG